MTLPKLDPKKRQHIREWAETSRSNLGQGRDRAVNPNVDTAPDHETYDMYTARPSSWDYQDTALGARTPASPSPTTFSSDSLHPQAAVIASSGAEGQAKVKKKRSNSQLLTKVIYHATGVSSLVEIERLLLKCTIPGIDVRGPTSLLIDKIITSMDSDSGDGKESAIVAACAPIRDRVGKKDTPNYFSKVWLYTNSRMPQSLPPLEFDPMVYSILRNAALYSRRSYDKGPEREQHSYVKSDPTQGTKAMVVKSVPVDDMNIIIFAIRGTQSYKDWAVNWKTAPISPGDFLEDPTNSCHSGFLSVAKNMVAPIAAQLRTLIEEDPGRMDYSLLFTGHSAGGAVASLLYMHMISESPSIQSELTHLRGCFRHIHCVTFGTPPISVRPLDCSDVEKERSMFVSFMNEGDPVCRADKKYFYSLLDLYAHSAPGSLMYSMESENSPGLHNHWRVPPPSAACAGDLVLLRDKRWNSSQPSLPRSDSSDLQSPLERGSIEACGITDPELRDVVFGDPLMHSMDLYCQRIEALLSSEDH